jgi:hypothetical protein
VKKSASVAVPLLASAALAMLAGCKQQQIKRCVNAQNVVVDEAFCETQPGQQNNTYNPNGVGFYRWYYGGGGGYYPGSFATGGGYVPSAGVSYSTSRGGFGSSFGGGEGEGGHGGSGE